MSQRGHGYGSEDHFIHYRTDYPDVLDSYIRLALAYPADITWLYPAQGVAEEPKDLTFVNFTEPQLKQWHAFWPSPGNRSWDGVAHCNGEWLLFEAKSNEAELCSPGTSASPASLAHITKALNQVKLFLGVPGEAVWHGHYYQYANRLAALYFLNVVANISARLIFLYFTGDVFPDKRPCPQDEQAWRLLINRCHVELKLPDKHKLSDRTHEVFVPVTAPGSR
jgi:hypothetical protein